MEFLPIFMRVAKRRCLVVGGGDVAARKVSLLLEAGAEVTLVAPELGTVCRGYRDEGRIHCEPRPFGADDVVGATVVIAATDNEQTNRAVYEAAVRHGVPVNVVDSPHLCTFIMPAIVDRSPVLVAVSTGGASPVLARLIRSRLEALVPPAYGRLAALAAKWRESVKARWTGVTARRQFWEQALEGPAAEAIFDDRDADAEALLRAALRDTDDGSPAGDVAFIASGPGDADLVPCRALRLLQRAETVLYDADVPLAVVALARRDASRRVVAEAPSEIGAELVTLCAAGQRVARLRRDHPGAGQADPEVEALDAAGYGHQEVPGVRTSR